MSYTVAKGNQRVDPDDVKFSGKALEGVVDLRSDTVTRPTAEMRQAMATAGGRRRVRRGSHGQQAGEARGGDF